MENKPVSIGAIVLALIGLAGTAFQYLEKNKEQEQKDIVVEQLNKIIDRHEKDIANRDFMLSQYDSLLSECSGK